MCACVSGCVFVFLYVCEYLFVCACVFICVHVCVCACVSMCVCTCACVYVCAHMCVSRQSSDDAGHLVRLWTGFKTVVGAREWEYQSLLPVQYLRAARGAPPRARGPSFLVHAPRVDRPMGLTVPAGSTQPTRIYSHNKVNTTPGSRPPCASGLWRLCVAKVRLHAQRAVESLSARFNVGARCLHDDPVRLHPQPLSSESRAFMPAAFFWPSRCPSHTWVHIK